MWLHAKRWILCVKTWIQFIKLLLHRLLGSWLSCVHERRAMGEIYGVPIKIIIRNRTWLICEKSNICNNINKIWRFLLLFNLRWMVINSSYSYSCYSTSTCLPACLPLFSIRIYCPLRTIKCANSLAELICVFVRHRNSQLTRRLSLRSCLI